MATHIALHEIGVAFEPKPLSFARKENRVSDYLALNPEGKVPTLLIDGKPLTEVLAILFWLAKSYPAADLLPQGLESDAQALSWMSFIAATLHPARSRGEAHARNVFAIADKRLGDREWALGRYSIADIHLFRLFWRFKGSFKPAAAEFPSLSAHYDRMMARAAVRKTIEIEEKIGYNLPA